MPPRQQLAISRTNRDIADTRLRESLVHTTANVKSGVLEPGVGARERRTRGGRRSSSRRSWRASTRPRSTSARRRRSTCVSAQAEVAAEPGAADHRGDRREAGRGSPAHADLRHRPSATNWNVTIDADRFAAGRRRAPSTSTPRSRARSPSAPTCCARARTSTTRRPASSSPDNQRLPDVRLNASYQASGLGGTQVLRTGGFPGTIVGPGADHRRSAIGRSISCSRTTTRRGRSASASRIPIGESVEQANYARAQLERSQSEQRLKSAEARAIQQVRDAGVEDRDEREADRDDPRGARAGRAAARRRAQAVRGRHVDELPGHPGAARSRAGARPTS